MNGEGSYALVIRLQRCSYDAAVALPVLVMKKFAMPARQIRALIVASAVCATLAFAPGDARCDDAGQGGKIGFEIQRVKRRDTQKPTLVVSADHKVYLEQGKRIQIEPLHFVRLYQTGSKKPLGPEIAVTSQTTAMAIAPDERTIAVGNWSDDSGGEVVVFDGVTGEKLDQWASGTVFELQFQGGSRNLRVVCGRAPKS